MTHFAVLCPEVPGHLNPMTTLMSELAQRGHRLTWIGTQDGEDLVEERGFEMITIGEEVFPRGSMQERLDHLGQLSGLAAARYTIDGYRQGMEAILSGGPDAVQASGATALLADETIFVSRTVADLTRLPWISVCNALPFHPEPGHPPIYPAWKYRTGWWARIRNWFGWRMGELALAPIARLIRRHRRVHGLADYDVHRENCSELATLAQIPQELDYPRPQLPDWFHYVGAMHTPTSRPPVPFPYEKLDDRPLVYASMGTIQNRLQPVFHSIAAACRDLPVQLVVTLGGGGQPEDLGELPGNPLVVPFAPQLELLQRARLVITHAGMNTTLESLAHGVPMVAIPVTNDQPAIARRIAWCGAGEFIPLRRISSDRLAHAIRRVLEDEQYTTNARRLAEANRQAGGVTRAADLVEQALA